MTGDEWRGTLHSKYLRFINIEHEAGYLLSITTDHDSMHGFAILVSQGCFDRCRNRLAVGHREMTSTNAKIYIDDELCVDFRNAKIYSGSVGPCESDLPRGDVVDIFSRFAKADQSSDKSVFRRRIDEILNESDIDFPDLSPIVGVGEGLTPSGDDFIVGALLVESLFPDSVSIDHDTLSANLHRTNLPGRTLLLGVLEGVFPTHAKRLAEAVCSPGNLEAAINETLGYGGSSGRDLCLGVAWSLALCD